jgi:tripartite-type tricarboxylate transporter receptor subunit TctC
MSLKSSRVMHRAAATLAVLGAVVASQTVQAQNYPSKPITVVVPFGAGSGTDIACRVFNKGAEDFLKQTMIVDNKPGGAAVVGTSIVAKSAPDGYTLLCLGGGSVSKTFVKNIPVDLLNDLTPVVQIARGAMFLIASDVVQAKTAQEFVEVIKKNPGKYNYGSIASTQMMPMEVLKDKAGLQMVNIPYKSLAGVQQAIASGDVVAYVSNQVGLESLFQSGKLRLLASLSEERNPCQPNVPAAPEVGLKGVSAPFSQGYWAPAKTPVEVINKLNEAYNVSLKTQATQDYIKNNCATPGGGAPKVQGDWVRNEHSYWTEAARISKFTPD